MIGFRDRRRTVAGMAIRLEITDDARELLTKRGGLMTIDYIRSTG